MPPHADQQEQPQVACTSCGRKFRYRPELAGRTVRCACGSAIMIPRQKAAAGLPTDGSTDVEDDAGEYEFASAPTRAPAAGARTVVALPSPVAKTDVVPASPDDLAKRVSLPPQRKGLTPEERACAEELDRPSLMLDWVTPSILIAVGVGLRFFETMSPHASQQPLPFGPAVGAVALKLVLSVSLLLGGMFLAVQVMEVCFVGALHRIAYKLIAIAIAPGALYPVLSHLIGEPYGAMTGTFVSLAAYGLLFWLLMQLDLKDTGICVLTTWILVTAANYAAYKAEGLMRESWV